VVHRDTSQIKARTAVAGAALIGFLTAIVALIVVARRRRRRPPVADHPQIWGLDDYTP
jgi:hypothetical protein